MNYYLLHSLLIFSIGFAVGGLAILIPCVFTNRELRKQVEKWQQKYHQSEEGWYRRFEELEKEQRS